MMMIAREDNLEQRMRFLESEMAGEKVVIRHILDCTHRNTEEIAAARVEVAAVKLVADRMVGDIALAKTTQVAQEAAMLNVLARDVRDIRAEMEEMRAEMGKELGNVHTEMSEMRMEMGEMHTETGEMRADVGQLRTQMDARFNAMERSMDARFDAVLAAIRTFAPHAAPAA